MTTNLPTTVSYTLEDILDRFEKKMDKQFAEVNQKFDEVNQKIDKQFAEVNQKLNQLEIGQVELSGEIKTLEEKINGIGKRIDNQEFVSRGVTVALMVSLIAGAAKLFGWLPTS